MNNEKQGVSQKEPQDNSIGPALLLYILIIYLLFYAAAAVEDAFFRAFFQ